MIRGEQPRLHQDHRRLSCFAPPAPLGGHPVRWPRRRAGRANPEFEQETAKCGKVSAASSSAPSAKSAVNASGASPRSPEFQLRCLRYLLFQAGPREQTEEI